jgi:DNA repair exonuclease SbcCD ATPase subunit
VRSAELRRELLQARLNETRALARLDRSTELATLQQQEQELTARAADALLSPAALEGELRRLQAQAQAADREAATLEQQALDAYVAGQRRLEKRQSVATLQATLARLTEHDLPTAKYAARILGPTGLQGRLLAASKAPLVDAVNQFLAPLGQGRFDLLLTDARGADVCQAGLWLPDGSWAEATLSGGQSLLVQAGLQLGLQRLASSPYYLLLLDGAEAIDEAFSGARGQFFRQLSALHTAGLVDQVLVTCCDQTDPAALADWQVIRTGKTTPVASWGGEVAA